MVRRTEFFQRLMTFPEFIDAAAERLKPIQGRLVQRHESDPAGASWWLTMTKAGCVYRIRFDRRAAVITLEREQGSFVPNATSTWRLLDSREPADLSFETALEVVSELLQRFEPVKR